MLRTVVIAIIIILAVMIIAFMGYKIYKYKQAEYAKECSRDIYAHNPILFNQYYCLNNRITDAETKLADCNNKIALYQSQINNGTLPSNVITTLQNAITCQNNYAAYLEYILNKYRTVSTDEITNSVTDACSKYYPVDGSVITDAGGIIPDCGSVLLPGITASDLSPQINCPMFA
jgi:hypothetical protein